MSFSGLPLVSIITPVYNGAQYLDALILSVKNQDYPLVEHIIIDDGSNDNEATINIFMKYDHLRWWTRPNQGQYATMNEGLLAAKGEIVCFICSDDIMTPGAVSCAVKNLVEFPEYSGVYGTFKYINSNGKKLNLLQPMQSLPTKLYPYSLHIAHSSFFIKRTEILSRGLLFNRNYKFYGDYDWLTRILYSKLNIMKVYRTLSLIRLHNQQTSRIYFFDMRKEMFSIQEKIKVSPFWASLFRKLWFLTNLINAILMDGIKSAQKIIIDRIHYRFNNYT